MPSWSETRERIEHAYERVKAAYYTVEGGVKKVKERPVLDKVARAAIGAIPLAGPRLLEWYESVGISEQERTEQMLDLLNRLRQQSEEQFERFSDDLATNLKEIIQNRLILTRLVSKTSQEILDEVRKVGGKVDSLGERLQANRPTATSEIVRQYREVRAKRWRELESLHYPALADDDVRRTLYGTHLALNLLRAYKGSGFVQFTSWAYSSTADLGRLKELSPALEGYADRKIKMYSLVSHQSKFLGEIRRSWRHLWDTSQPQLQLQQQQDDTKTLNELKQSWSGGVELPLSDRPTPCEFTYDPEGRRFSIRILKNVSTSPSDYPKGVSTASELLTFLSAVLYSPVAFLGEIDVIPYSYPLYKIVLDILDRRVDIGKVRVGVDNCEEWDYINTEADNELRLYRGRID